MYITINNIKSEKRIDLFYSIQNFDSDKEIAVIRMMFSTSTETSFSHGPYFRHEKVNSKWNLCRQRAALHARRDH